MEHEQSFSAIGTSFCPATIWCHTLYLICGDRNIPLETSEALMEMGFGIWEGRVHADVFQRDQVLVTGIRQELGPLIFSFN
ncbi:histidine phosphatase family protein [Paenibacillus jilunlii]|uniref:histidine phosphatase family protein n=1 Tax=Paenibacillus jilunlii TaxID=682956 RepID=UPI000944C8C0